MNGEMSLEVKRGIGCNKNNTSLAYSTPNNNHHSLWTHFSTFWNVSLQLAIKRLQMFQGDGSFISLTLTSCFYSFIVFTCAAIILASLITRQYGSHTTTRVNKNSIIVAYFNMRLEGDLLLIAIRWYTLVRRYIVCFCLIDSFLNDCRVISFESREEIPC